MRENEEFNRCPMCENHCPEDAPECGRGRRYFEESGMRYTAAEYGDEHRRHHDVPPRRHCGGHPDMPEEGGRHFREHDHPMAEERRGCHGRGPGEFDGDSREHSGRRPHPEFLRDPESLEGMFMMCARKMRHNARRRFGSTQDRIIRILDENGGTMGQKALQELLRVQPGSISEILAKMEEKGLINRSRDDEDKRASLITLQTEALPDSDETSCFSVLSEEEKESLKELLKKVLEANKPE